MEEDSDDEWFLDSIKRYKQLIMFDTGNPVQQIELCDDSCICLLCERNSGQKVISILSLPSKVTQTYLGSCEIQQSNDLKIKTGIFPSSPPSRILAIYGENRLLAAQNNTCGLVVYNIKVSDTEQILYNTTIKCCLTDPEIALINKSRVVLTKDTQQKSFIGDLNSGEILRDFIFSESHSNSLIPVCLNENIIAFSEKPNGTTYLYNWNSSEMIGKIYAGEESDAIMFASSSYSYLQNSSSSRNIYFLSQSGIFKVYDLRDTTRPFIRHDLKMSTVKEYLKLRFNPDNCNIVSVSGFDNSVYLFDISKNMSEIFKHDGHSRTEDCNKNTSVTDHLWYPNEFLISAALNNSINCWIPDIVNR